MLELARGEALGEGVGDFLEFQRAFQRDRIAHMTAEEQEGMCIDHLLGGLLDIARLVVQYPLDFFGHALELLQDVPDLVAVHRALHLRQIQAQQIGGDDLRDEGLGGGDRNFRARVRVEHGVGFAWDARALRVADCQHARPLFAGVAQGHQRVHGLAGLRDRDDQRARGQNRVAVTEFMRELHLDRDAHPMLDRVLGDHARVACRAACHDDDFVNLAEHVQPDMHFVEHDIALVVEAAEQRIGHGLRVLVNLLVHEGRPAAFFRRGSVPIDGETFGILRRVAVEIGDDYLVATDAHGLVLPDLHGMLGVGDERGDIGAEEVLSLAQAHHKRGIMPRADDDIRLAAVHGKDGERAGQHAGHAPQRLKQIRFAGFLDDGVGDFAEQFRRDFGIGAGGEHVAFGLQVHFQLGRVLDDAVVDDGDLAVRAHMRVGVRVARLAVGGPAGVADADGRVRQRRAGEIGLEIVQAPGLLAYRHQIHARRGEGDAGGIIPPVL